MSQQATWWDPESGQDGDVVRHAPDDENYHYPDGRQLERMRSGMGVPVTVPKARSDGRSMAFDGTKAGIVHVDPDAPDGGAIVDLTRLSGDDVDRALNTSRYPHEVFYKLGVSPAPDDTTRMRKPVQRRDNPLIGSGYVVPASDEHGRQVPNPPARQAYGEYQMAQLVKESNVLPAAPQLPPVPQSPVHGPSPYQQPPLQTQPPPTPQPPPHYPQQPYGPAQYQQPYYPPPPTVDPNVQAMLGQLLQGVNAIANRVKELEDTRTHEVSNGVPSRSRMDSRRDQYGRSMPVGQPARRPRKQAEGPEEEDVYAEQKQKPVFEDDEAEIGRPRPLREDRRTPKTRKPPPVPQHLDDYVEEEEEEIGFPRHRDGIIVGFETLRIPFVTGPKPLRPKRKVIFDLGEMGKNAAIYHDVLESVHNVVLVYDTRYEEGTQHEPPELSADKTVELHVPSLKKTFKIASIGQSFSFGIFDFVVLVKNENDEALDFEEE